MKTYEEAQRQHVNVIYPKFKMGEEVVREVAEPPTYGMYSIASPLCSDMAYG